MHPNYFPFGKALYRLANMERDLTPESMGDESQSPSAFEAAEILRGMTVDSSRLADNVVTPLWYHPILGLIIATFVLAQALPMPLGIWLVTLGIIAISALTTAYTRHYGVLLTQPTGKRSGRMLATSIGVLALAMAAAFGIRLAGFSPWWILPVAIGAFMATVVLGRRYDRTLRMDLSEGLNAT